MIERRKTEAWASINDGVRSTLGAPGLVSSLWLANLLLAFPAGWLVRQHVSHSIGPSLFHQTLREGFDLDWYSEYEQATGGLAATLRPSIVGPGAVLDNLELWFSGGLFSQHLSLLALALAHAVLWLLLLGGIIARLAGMQGLETATDSHATGEVLGPAGLILRGVRMSPRILQLSVVAGLLYFAVYRLAWIVFPWIERACHDVTQERTLLTYHLIAAACVVALLTAVNLLFDYAKIVVVLEPKLSPSSALARAMQLVVANAGQVALVYYGLGAALLAVSALYLLLAPGAGQSTTLGILGAFVVGQLYLWFRFAGRLVFLGSATALYGRLCGKAAPLPSAGRP